MEVDDGDDDGDDHDAGDHDHDHDDSCGELTIILQSLKVGHNVTCTTESCRRKVASRSLPQKSAFYFYFFASGALPQKS